MIVVDQMMTGFDSKWINTLYLDKLLRYENIIQAFSRTNRLFAPDKPFGTIRYYRKPHTMERNIEKAVKLYSGDKPIGLFVEKLEYNLFKAFNDHLEVAKIQGFTWEQPTNNGNEKEKTPIEMKLDENIYLILALRYKELFNGSGAGGGAGGDISRFDYFRYLMM